MKRIALIVVIVVAAVVATAGIALAARNSFDDPQQPITGTALARASEAALASTGGGGRVTETEVGGEDSYYEVEVTLADGRQVDVQLDKSFSVVSTKADSDSSSDQDNGSD